MAQYSIYASIPLTFDLLWIGRDVDTGAGRRHGRVEAPARGEGTGDEPRLHDAALDAGSEGSIRIHAG